LEEGFLNKYKLRVSLIYFQIKNIFKNNYYYNIKYYYKLVVIKGC